MRLAANSPACPALRAITLGLAAACVLQTGCLRKRLIVRSNPPGAAVQIDNQPIGVTPASTDYVYYGTREVKLSMPGYETLTVNQPLPTPWYALPGIDFFTENLWPFRIDDRRELNFNLQRQRMAPAGEIIARGEQLRQQAAPQGAAPIGTPLNAAPSAGLGIPNTPPAAMPMAPTQTPTIQPSPSNPPLFGAPTTTPGTTPAPSAPPSITPIEPAPSFGAPTLPRPLPGTTAPNNASPQRFRY